jgi:hypothetical protein
MTIENTVRTIVAGMLSVEPYQVRPESMLLIGTMGPHTLRRIAGRVCDTYGLDPEDERLRYDGWTTVADVIETVERMTERKAA